MKLAQLFAEANGIFEPITDKEVSETNKRLSRSGGKLIKNIDGTLKVDSDVKLKEATNHLGEKEYTSYKSWKTACKTAGAEWFDGDQDIGQALKGPKPYVRGKTVTIGEWDGEKGSVYNLEEAVARKGSIADEIQKSRARENKKWQEYEIKDNKVGNATILPKEKTVKEAANFELDDIAIGGTVIYKSIKTGDYKMSKCRSKTDKGFLVHLQDGSTIQTRAIVSTDASDWNEYKNKNAMKESEQLDEETFTDFEDWKAAVLNSYPQQAKKIKFKGRFEGGKHTISAEVPGLDRSFGTWDGDEETGVVLSEANSQIKEAFKKVELEETSAEISKTITEIMQDIVIEFKNKEVSNTSVPSAPNTSTMRAQKSGKLTFEKNVTVNGSYGITSLFKFYIKIGGAIPVKDQNSIIKYFLSRLDEAFDVDAAVGMSLVSSDGVSFYLQETDGTNWSGIGFIVKQEKKVSEDIDAAQSVTEGFSPYKLGAKVQIIKGPKDCIGQIGTIAEIRKDVSGNKTFTVDYAEENGSTKPNFGAKSVQLKSSDIKLVK